MGRNFYRKRDGQKRNADEVRTDSKIDKELHRPNRSNIHRNRYERHANRNSKLETVNISNEKETASVLDRGNDDFSCVLDATNFVLAHVSEGAEYAMEYADYEFEEQYTTSYLKSISKKNDQNLKAESHSGRTTLPIPSRAKENLDCINQQIIAHPFSDLYEYSHYASAGAESHMAKEEFKHIYHVLRYLVSSIRSYGKSKASLRCVRVRIFGTWWKLNIFIGYIDRTTF
jgi:hypothetical protein